MPVPPQVVPPGDDVSFDPANPAYDNLKIYRDFRFGNLAHLVMTDERLYRDDHVVNETSGSETIGSRYFVPQSLLLAAEATKTSTLGRAPSILGTTQRPPEHSGHHQRCRAHRRSAWAEGSKTPVIEDNV